MSFVVKTSRLSSKDTCSSSYGHVISKYAVNGSTGAIFVGKKSAQYCKFQSLAFKFLLLLLSQAYSAQHTPKDAIRLENRFSLIRNIENCRTFETIRKCFIVPKNRIGDPSVRKTICKTVHPKLKLFQKTIPPFYRKRKASTKNRTVPKEP